MSDLAARDEVGDRWTHYWKIADEYSRIDYILVSPAMSHEYVPAKSRIYRSDFWYDASDHRPVFATIMCGKQEMKKTFIHSLLVMLTLVAGPGTGCGAAGDADQGLAGDHRARCRPQGAAEQRRCRFEDGAQPPQPTGESVAQFCGRASPGCPRLRSPVAPGAAAGDPRRLRGIGQAARHESRSILEQLEKTAHARAASARNSTPAQVARLMRSLSPGNHHAAGRCAQGGAPVSGLLPRGPPLWQLSSPKSPPFSTALPSKKEDLLQDALPTGDRRGSKSRGSWTT